MNGNPLFSRKDIAKILLPLVLQNILTITIGMVDSIMVSGDGGAGRNHIRVYLRRKR